MYRTARNARPKLQGMGTLAAAQGRRALHPRPGQLRRRHQAAGHAVRRHRAQPLCACAHQGDRQERRRWRCPGVVAVLTADDLKPVKLHWMPTLGGDVQAVLADKKVRFQMQEVALVLATDRYAAADGAALVEVDYEELPAIVDPKQCDGAGRADHPRGHRRQERSRPRPAHAPQPHLHLGRRRQGRRRRGVRERRGDGARGDPQPARASVPARDLRLRRHLRQGHRLPDGLHDLAGAAPGAHRAAMLSGMAESKIRMVGGDIGGGFGNKVPVYPGYVVAIVASIVTGVPVKWIESRIDNISTTGFARDYHGVGELAADKDGRIKALRFNALADHGAFNSHVSATKLPAGLFHICSGSYDIPDAYCRVEGVYTNKAPGGVAYRCSFRVTEAVYLIERMVDILAQKLGIDKAEIRRRNFMQGRAVPLHDVVRLDARRGDYHTALQRCSKPSTTRACASEQARNAPTRTADADGHRPRDVHRDRRRRAHQDLRHPRHRPVRQLRDPRASHRQRDRAPGHDEPGPGPRDDVRADHCDRARPPVRGDPVEEGDTDKAPYGAGTWGSRSTPVAGAAVARRHARSRRRRRRSPRTCSKWARAISTGRSTASRSRATRPAKTMKDIAWRRTRATCRPAWSRGSTRPLLRPAELDVPVRRLRVRRRHRQASPARPRCGASMRSTTAARGSTR